MAAQSIQEIMKSSLATNKVIQEIRSATMTNTQAIAKLESQISQLANHMGERERGKFPSQPVLNLKEQFVIGNPSISTQE